MRSVAISLLLLSAAFNVGYTQIQIKNLRYREGYHPLQKDMLAHNGGVWFSDTDGVTFWDGNTAAFYNVDNGLMLDSVNAISTGLRGEILFMGRSGYATKDASGWHFVPKHGYQNEYSFMERIGDELWVSPYYPLYKLTLKANGTYDTLMVSPPLEFFDEIEKDSKGNYYLKAIFNSISIKKGEGNFEQQEGLQDAQSIHVDKNDILWIGGYGRLLKKGVDELEFTIVENPVLPVSASVRAIDSDADGGMFLATSAGLIVIQDNTWTMIDESMGLLDNDCYDIEVDAMGIIWVATKGGVARISLNPGNNDAVLIGRVFHDVDGDGIQDVSEPGLKGHFIKLTPGNAFVITDSNGEFKFTPDVGENTLTWPIKSFWTIGEELRTISFVYPETIASSLHFALSWTAVEDVATYLSSTAVRPGFDATYYLDYTNVGSVTANTTLTFEHDERLTFLSSSVSPARVTANRMEWDIADLKFLDYKQIWLTFNLPSTTALGTELKNLSAIAKLPTELEIENNSDTLFQVVTGSFDPNDKLVREGVFEDNLVLHETPLTYTIRFQNTGTDTAFTVKIKDVIHPSLRLSSLEVLSSSHSYETTLQDREITFLFKNIKLPDSTRNEPKSHGFIKYRVHPESDLANNTIITNQASIYFDFNEPVETNVVSNKFVSILPDGRITASDPFSMEVVRLYPNPARENVIVTGHESFHFMTTEIVDALGRTVERKAFQNVIDTSGLPAGFYMIRFFARQKIATLRAIIRD